MPLDLSLDLAESTSAEDWVKRSRQQGATTTQPRHAAESKESTASQSLQNYSSRDLQGMQIMHDSAAFDVGEEVVLTLADTEVVKRDEYGRIVAMNDDGDALENVNIAEGERKEDRDKRLKRLRQPIYQGYDDEEFEEGAFPGKKQSILSQYDKEKKRGAKLVIGDGVVNNLPGSISSTSGSVLGEKSNQIHNLRTEYKMANDFVDSSEVKFKKSKKIDDKKRKRLREKSPDRNDDGKAGDENKEEDYDMSKILDGGEDEAVSIQPAKSASQDLSNEKKLPLSSLANKKRKVNFFSTQLWNSSAQSVVYDNEDPDLAVAMARARKSAIAARQKDPSAMDEDDEDRNDNSSKTSTIRIEVDEEDRGAKIAREIALRAAQVTAMQDRSFAESKEDNNVNDVEDEDIDVEGRRSDGKLVFNSTTEFASRLQARLTDRARLASELAMRDVNRNASTSVDSGANVQYVNGKTDDSSVSKIVVDSRTTNNLTAGSEPDEDDDEDWESVRNQRMEQTDNDKLDDEFIMDIEEDDDDDGDDGDGDEDVADDEQLAFLHRQPTFSKGLGATLALLKGSGELNKPKLQAGRARDQRDSDQGQDKSGIQLEYRDEYGNKLTKKEEFRRLSYQFHGQGPGKKKLEKRIKVRRICYLLVKFIIICCF